ncbi:MAG: hypothetical protein RIB93_31130 [Coleofasciculus sp. D1-CHI-01]
MRIRLAVTPPDQAGWTAVSDRFAGVNHQLAGLARIQGQGNGFRRLIS